MPKNKAIVPDEGIDNNKNVGETSKGNKKNTSKKNKIASDQGEPDKKPSKILTKSEIMKEHLDKQPKVRIIIPLEKGESRNSVETVILNGYRLNIKKGVYVDVPQQVADIIKDSYLQTEQAHENALKNIPESERAVFDNSN